MQPDASAPPPFGEPIEIVSRPDPGTLARGLWEAPAWTFYVGVGFVVLAALAYAANRAGLLRRKQRANANASKKS